MVCSLWRIFEPFDDDEFAEDFDMEKDKKLKIRIPIPGPTKVFKDKTKYKRQDNKKHIKESLDND